MNPTAMAGDKRETVHQKKKKKFLKQSPTSLTSIPLKKLDDDSFKNLISNTGT